MRDDFDDQCDLHLVAVHLVDRAPVSVETDGTLVLALPFERLVVKAGHLSYFLKPARLDIQDPSEELPPNLLRQLLQLSLGQRRKLDELDHGSYRTPIQGTSSIVSDTDHTAHASERRASASAKLSRSTSTTRRPLPPPNSSTT